MKHKPQYVGLHLHRFPKGLWRKLKHRALREGKSMNKIVADMLRRQFQVEAATEDRVKETA
jgi:plasmid stability protein